MSTQQHGSRAAQAALDPFAFRRDVTVRPGDGARTVRIGFTSVEAGNLAFHVLGGESGGTREQVARARRELEACMGVPAGSTAYVTQVHSADVVDAAIAGGWEQATGVEADAIVSPSGAEPLAIMVADCLPVVLVDERTGATAVAHAGRRGLLDGVLQSTVERLFAVRPKGVAPAGAHAAEEAHRRDEAPAAGLRAWIGPSICGDCYEVPEAMRAESAQIIPEAHATTSWGTAALDLRAGAEAVLTRLGVEVERVERCTREDETLFSHRRAPGRGRFAGVVWTERVPPVVGPGSDPSSEPNETREDR